jgi:cytochrome c-type biogenesis protein CcmH/NrfG
MDSEANTPPQATIWSPMQAFAMATVCLVIGLAVGYLVRGSASPAPPPAAATAATQPAGNPHTDPGRMPSLDEIKKMADKQAEPLLAKLKDDPKNATLLNQIGTLYRVAHQFQAASDYYQKVLEIDPKNVGARTDLASCLYYKGDVDGAIAQLNQSLKYDPNHAGTLFNLGIIEWQGKGDAKDAIANWEKLLKAHPEYERKEAVQQLIAQAKAHPKLPAQAR